MYGPRMLVQYVTQKTNTEIMCENVELNWLILRIT